MKEIPFFLLVIFSAFTMNPVLQCGLGINSESGNPGRLSTFIKLGIIFITVILLWNIFSLINSIISGIYIYVLLFPVSYISYAGLEHLIFHILKRDPQKDHTIGFPGGITAAALFISFGIANNFIEVLALAFGFTFGTLIVFLILSEIQKRSVLEAVPRYLRGKPLILISMGLLSLVLSKASILLFRIIGN